VVLLDAMVIIGAGIAFFMHPPASETGRRGIVGFFTVIMAIVGILAGSGSILARLEWIEPHLSARVRGLLGVGDRLAAVKAYRAETGADYQQAIAVIDAALQDVQRAV